MLSSPHPSSSTSSTAVPPPSSPPTDEDTQPQSCCYFSKFTLNKQSFMLFVADDPQQDDFSLTLSSTMYIYTYTGSLLSLRPAAVSVNDVIYHNYIVNGLRQQDQQGNSYEYELIQQEHTAQLLLYKQLGDTTRVPVCIARFPLSTGNRDTTTTISTADAEQQAEQLYRQRHLDLMSALYRWNATLSTQLTSIKQQTTEQQAQLSWLQELIQDEATQPQQVEQDLLTACLPVLNGEKQKIRDIREKIGLLTEEVKELQPKPATAAVTEQEGTQSDSEAENNGADVGMTDKSNEKQEKKEKQQHLSLSELDAMQDDGDGLILHADGMNDDDTDQLQLSTPSSFAFAASLELQDHALQSQHPEPLSSAATAATGGGAEQPEIDLQPFEGFVAPKVKSSVRKRARVSAPATSSAPLAVNSAATIGSSAAATASSLSKLAVPAASSASRPPRGTGAAAAATHATAAHPRNTVKGASAMFDELA